MSAAALMQRDTVLADIIPQLSPTDWESTGDVFGDVACCIVEQQIPYRARGVWFDKLLTLLGEAPLRPHTVLQVEEDAWRQRKLSGPKYKTLITFAQQWQEQGMDDWTWEQMGDEQVFEKLTAIKGIGPQTAQLVLLYTLRRPDIFPEGDYQLKKIMSHLYELPADRQLSTRMLGIAEAWRPHRSLAVRYLLAWRKANRKR